MTLRNVSLGYFTEKKDLRGAGDTHYLIGAEKETGREPNYVISLDK